jgi:hypothetical protein
MHTILPTTIWSNNDFIELDDEHKLCYFWMQTNANTAGYVSVSPKRLKRDIDIDFECFEKACEVMGDNFHRMEGGFWIRDYIKQQIGEGEKLAANHMSATVIKHLMKDSPQSLQEIVLKEYPTLHRRLEEYLRPKEALTKPLPSPHQGDAKGKEKEKEEDMEMDWEKVWEKEGEKATEREELQFRKALRETDFAPETPEPKVKAGHLGIEDIRAASRSARVALEKFGNPF